MSSAADIADEQLTPRPAGLGPSDTGSCRAYLGFRETGQEPDADYVDDDRAAEAGNLIHEAKAARRQRQYPESLVEKFVDIPGLDRPGRLDWYFDGVVDDLKTLSGRRYESTMERGRPWDDHRSQANIYALGMVGEGFEVHSVSITYYCRDDGHEHVFTWPYDAAEAHADLAWLLGVQEAIDQGWELPRDGRGPGLGFPCDWCPFARTCWGVDNVPEGRTPQSALVLTDEDTIAAARAFLDAKLAKSEAERAYKATQAALVGLGGALVELDGQRREIRWARDSSWDELDGDAAAALLESEGLPVPTKVRSRRGALTIPVVGE